MYEATCEFFRRCERNSRQVIPRGMNKLDYCIIFVPKKKLNLPEPNFFQT